MGIPIKTASGLENQGNSCSLVQFCSTHIYWMLTMGQPWARDQSPGNAEGIILALEILVQWTRGAPFPRLHEGHYFSMNALFLLSPLAFSSWCMHVCGCTHTAFLILNTKPNKPLSSFISSRIMVPKRMSRLLVLVSHVPLSLRPTALSIHPYHYNEATLASTPDDLLVAVFNAPLSLTFLTTVLGQIS